jgi:hypothetical protein
MTLTIGTNSESLITCIAKETGQKTLHPNATLATDWDITHEIQHNLRSYVFTPSIEHVKGHQDVDTQYDDLSLLAQLNVNADVLASQSMLDHPCTTTCAQQLTHNLCQLELPSGSIHGHYKNALRRAALCGNMWDYLKARNHWTEQTISCID